MRPERVEENKSIRLLGQAVKTPPFHGGNRGSNPLGVIFLKRKTYNILYGAIAKW